MKNQIVTFLFFWLGQISFFIFNFISSKELSISEFGEYSIVLAVIMFGMRFMEVGIGDYYVISGNEKNLKTIFVVNFAKGLLVFIIFLSSSFFFNDFYGSNQLFGLVFFVSFIFILESLKNPVIYKFYKEKKMIPVVLIERGTYLLSIAVGIFLMYHFKSAWVLVAVYFFYFLTQTLISYIVLPIFSKSKFDKDYAKEVTSFSKYIIGFILLTYTIRQGLDLIIPKMIGISEFAIYSFTFLIGISPTNFLIYPFNKLIFPIYTLEVNNNSLGIIVNKVFTHTIYLIVFLSLTIYFASPSVLKFLNNIKLFDYDLLGIILIYSFIRGLAANLGVIFKALNKQKIYNRILILEAVIIFSMFLFFHENAKSIIMVIGLAIIIHLTAGLFILNKYINIYFKKFILNLLICIGITLVELFLSKETYYTQILIIFNFFIFSILGVRFLMSFKPYFKKS